MNIQTRPDPVARANELGAAAITGLSHCESFCF
jgi:hypothetical protein